MSAESKLDTDRAVSSIDYIKQDYMREQLLVGCLSLLLLDAETVALARGDDGLCDEIDEHGRVYQSEQMRHMIETIKARGVTPSQDFKTLRRRLIGRRSF